MAIKEGDVILASMPQSGGQSKNRPAIILREFPYYGDFLVCGLSTQLNQYIENFDEIISQDDEDFKSSGLVSKSLIRLSFLAVLPNYDVIGSIGMISSNRHKRLLRTLSNYLIKNLT